MVKYSTSTEPRVTTMAVALIHHFHSEVRLRLSSSSASTRNSATAPAISSVHHLRTAWISETGTVLMLEMAPSLSMGKRTTVFRRPL